MPELHLRIIPPYAGDNFAPQPRALKYIGFVHRQNFAAPLRRQIEGNTSDPFDFRFAVAHSVDRNPRARNALDRTWLPEIRSPQQLPHDHDVSTAHQFRAQRRAILERWKKDRRPQIRISSQLPPQAQQSGLRPQMPRIVIERWASYCT